jgi:hypothetical protein
MVLHRPLEPARLSGNWDSAKKPLSGKPTFLELAEIRF